MPHIRASRALPPRDNKGLALLAEQANSLVGALDGAGYGTGFQLAVLGLAASLVWRQGLANGTAEANGLDEWLAALRAKVLAREEEAESD